MSVATVGTGAGAVVVELGSGVMRGGLSEQPTPAHVFPTVVGRAKTSPFPAHMAGPAAGSGIKVGHDAQVLRKFLDQGHPVNPNGIVTNWEDFEVLLRHLYKTRLNAKAWQQPLLLADSFRNPRALREKAIELLFEEFCVNHLCMANQASLTSEFYQSPTCLCIDFGFHTTKIIPIVDSLVSQDGVKVLGVGRKHLIEALGKGLSERGEKVNALSDSATLSSILDQHCFLSTDYQNDSYYAESDQTFYRQLERSYLLPDGNNLFISQERFEIPEILMRPNLWESSLQETLAEAVIEVIMSSDKSVRMDFRENVNLCGGSSIFPKLSPRLHDELVKLDPENRYRIRTKKHREHAAWCGAARMAQEDQLNWITPKLYQEYGNVIIHKKWPY